MEPVEIEVVDDEMAGILAAKTGAERLEIAFGMWRSARTMIASQLRSEHPGWDERRLADEVARRLGHATR